MNVFLADHHPVFRRGLKSLMKDVKEYTVKGKAESGKDLIENVKAAKADIVLLEIDLPESKGIGEVRDLRAQFPNIKVLVVSCHPEEMYAASAIKAGANGYISKVKSSKEIKKAIAKVARGEQYLSEEILTSLNSGRKNGVMKFKKLSKREIEVLNLLSKGLRNKDVAKELNINEKTVSTYKNRLLKKLKATSIADLIHQARIMQLAN